MLTALLLTIGGLALVIKAADVFIDQASILAKRLKISSFIIGFTVVAFGTSLPELTVSTYATISGHTGIAVSNVIGSNIANICLILGITALFVPYKLRTEDVHINIPLSLATLLFFVVVLFINNMTLGTLAANILLVVFFLILITTKQNNHHGKTTATGTFHWFYLLIAIGVLAVAGRIVVDNALILAATLGVQETLLGYFIIAVGTSFPELVASIAAVKKGNAEIGLGNILGSNLFNLYFILSISALFSPISLSAFVIELVFLVGLTILLVVLALVGKRYYLTRTEGFFLISAYLIFVITHVHL